MSHAGDTTCVAFVPGFMQRGDAWAPVAGRVARRWRTELVDFGEPTLDASVAAIRDACNGGGAVVAYSMGGRIALHAADRHRGAFRALVLVGATPGLEDGPGRRSRRAADNDLAAWMERQRIDTVVDHWESQSAFASQAPDVVAAQRAGRLSHDPRALARMLRATGQAALEPLWDTLEELVVPILAVAGEHDPKYVETAERMAERLPRGRAAVVPDAGHAPHLDQPEAFSDLLLPFLDEHLG